MNTTATTIGAFEAKTHLSELLKKVQAGQHFMITVRGTVIAELKPVPSQREQALAALDTLRQMREAMKQSGRTFTHDEIKAMIHEGHNY
jgi:prevent-host-death family protein